MSTQDTRRAGALLAAEVVDGPMEGVGLATADGTIRAGRGADCALVLTQDPWVSRRHVRFGLGAGGLHAEDEGGRNGTWLSEGRIAGRVPLSNGDVLVVGRTPVQVTTAQEPFDDREPVPPPRISPAVRKILDAAARVAQVQGRLFVDTACVLVALLEQKDTAVASCLSAASVDVRALAERASKRWVGDREWVAALIDEAAGNFTPGPTPETPKVLRTVDRATRIAADRGASDAEAQDLLAALLHEPRGPVAEILAEAGLKADVAASPADEAGPPTAIPTAAQPAGTGEKASVVVEEQEETPTSPGGTPAAAPDLFELESWDVFREAKEVRDRIRAVQATYHLADPDQRRRAIDEVLAEAFERVVPDRRDRVLRHLSALFPILDESGERSEAEAEIDRLRAEVERLKAALLERKDAPRNQTDAAGLLAALLAPGDEKDDEAVRILRAVVRFAMDAERFVSSVVQSFQSRTADLTRYVIPPFRRDLKDMVRQAAAEGADEEKIQLLQSYLNAVRQWLIGSIVGYNKAASAYGRDLLARLDPRAIEKGADLPRWRDAMGMSDAELWRRYKELYADLEPDLVDDQVQEQAGKLASREVEGLKTNSR